jgi:hypothetical protein
MPVLCVYVENFATIAPSSAGFRLLAPRSSQLNPWHYNLARFEDLASRWINGHYHFSCTRRALAPFAPLLPWSSSPSSVFHSPFPLSLVVVFLPRLCSSRTAVPACPVLHRISPFPADLVPPRADPAPVVHSRPSDTVEISYLLL